MADIIITCPSCGNQIAVSEFVSAESLTCMKCKTSVPIPREMPAGTESARPRLQLHHDAPPPTPVQAPPPPRKRSLFGARKHTPAKAASLGNTLGTVQASMPSIRRRVRKRRFSSWTNTVMPWIVFVILTLVFCYLRYWPKALPAARLDMLITGAIGALAFLHVSVIVYAFGEDPFHSVLCALIPGYSIYYLFTQADQFILRALAAALLIAFGVDTSIAIKNAWLSFYKTTNAFLEDSHLEK